MSPQSSESRGLLQDSKFCRDITTVHAVLWSSSNTSTCCATCCPVYRSCWVGRVIEEQWYGCILVSSSGRVLSPKATCHLSCQCPAAAGAMAVEKMAGNEPLGP
uniref:Uncharacterized protein n=1 Tax=Engystomops pustulosus TaxID=76066 RepID=A0AAV6YR96_ENGPU|nr:hypothetical protein GDO81_020352 [Engystomops pustulosus]